MNNKKFWKWEKSNRLKIPDIIDEMSGEKEFERTLFLDGVIAEESWFDDKVTPKLFKDELTSGTGNITVWINSVGGDCVAAARIYNMLTEYSGKVTVKIDGIAASAASVIAMAGDEILMSPVSTMMIHNPLTFVCGDHTEMQKAIDMLNEVKESIINAYAIKTGLSRAKLSRLMEAETWMNANKAVELGFADGIIERERTDDNSQMGVSNVLFSCGEVGNTLFNKLTAKYGDARTENPTVSEHSVSDITERLNYIKNFI